MPEKTLTLLATGSFEKDGIGWQWQQLQQRLGEWWELQINQWFSKMSEIPVFKGWDLSSLEGIFRGLLILLLTVLLIWIIWQIWQRFQVYLVPSIIQKRDLSLQRPVTDLSPAGWWEQSHNFQQQGNYHQACRCLYLGMLQRLHDSGIIPHQTSRTDREYRLLLLQLPYPEPYETLLRVHQQLCFGNGEASPALLAECERSYEKIMNYEL